MTWADRGYLVIQAIRPSVEDALILDHARAALQAVGWRRAISVEGLEVHLGPGSPLKARLVHRRHVLIGEYCWRERALSAVIGGSRDPVDLGRGAVGAGWGRYILAWGTDDDRLGLLRDPSGAIDCLAWRRGGLRVAADQLPPEIDLLLPEAIAIDWPVLGEIADQPGLLTDRPPLREMTSVTPGDVVLVGDRMEAHAVWRPADACRGRSWDDSPDGLRRVVDGAVAGVSEGHSILLGEISGGLDSAIVSSSLTAVGGGAKASYVNYFGDWAEGDERAYAKAAAAKSGARLAMARKPVAPITPEMLAPLGWGFRPALHGVDVAYDDDMARRIRRLGATALITGQGGDAVFFQAPDPQVVIDRHRREGLRGLDPRYWAEVGRWTRHSAWTLGGLALWPPRPSNPVRRRHPWLEGADDMPPAKRGQILRLANCQLFWSDCRRSRAAELLHPLLTQPVIEHVMAVPADRLILGVRDRGLARVAFSGRLPSSILERRDKGDLSQFYGRVVLSSLAELRPFLLDGLLSEHRLIDRVDLERELTPERVVWSPLSNRPLLLAVLETWARHWTERLDRCRWAQIARQPVEDPSM
jgi:asparagine synthase (glutamine-hydrolysing)